MRSGVGKWAGALLLASAVAVAEPGGEGWALPTESLTGLATKVPGDLPDDAVLIVGFSRASSEQTSAWRSRLLGDESAPPTYAVFVIADAGRLMRGMAKRMMRSGIPEERHAATLVATEEGDAWREFTNFDDESTAYVLRFKAQRLCHRYQGAVSEAEVARLIESCSE